MEPMEAAIYAAAVVLPAALLFDLAILVCHPGKWRNRMAALLLPLALSILLLAPGGYGLGRLGLAWRSGVRLCLLFLTTVCLTGLLVFAAWYLIERLEGRAIYRWGVAITAFALSVCVFAAGAFVTVFAPGEDQVVAWEGQRAVAVRWCLSDVLDIYEYHGPLLRGDTRLNKNDAGLEAG